MKGQVVVAVVSSTLVVAGVLTHGNPAARAQSTPTIASFSPQMGIVGTEVTVTGDDFTNTTDVQFNGVSAAFTIDSDTQITTSVPQGATTGPISVVTSGRQPARTPSRSR